MADVTVDSVDPRSEIVTVLEGSGELTREALNRARLAQRESGERLESVITRLGLISEQRLCELLAAASGLEIVSAEKMGDLPSLEPRVSDDFLRDIQAVPIGRDSTTLHVAVLDPFDTFVAQSFEATYGLPVRRLVARSSDIETAIARLSEGDATLAEDDDVFDAEDVERLRDLVSDAPAIRAVNRLIAQAVDERASDIHLEPAEDCLIVRYRVDGILREVARLPQAVRASVVSRIKVVAGLDLAEKRLPQDGRMRIAVRGHETDLRVATAPSMHGESVVLRILDRSRLALDFNVLGFDEALSGAVLPAIHRPYGIVLVTGPTGSGKTTTLYAALSELNRVERKLLTIEDPVEYRLPGVIQAQVQPGIGFTFATALRSFLRQDPDVIMVGEIRDVETAEIAVQAALTGHMILSTLHTNTAAGAITRLLDMQVEPFLLSSVLTGVLAQRLVRKLCADCSVPFTPDAALLASLGLTDRGFRRAVGCPACRQTGYAGRLALFEFITVDDSVAGLILHGADTTTIEQHARASGSRSLLEDGLSKAAAGQTTIEEVLRVVGGE